MRHLVIMQAQHVGTIEPLEQTHAPGATALIPIERTGR
jgi:hypothetical protein